jgi:transposase-like protein
MTKRKKSRRARRSFSPEFKADVVRLCQSNGEKVGDVAKRLSLTETAVRAWVKRAGVDAGGGATEALTSTEREEVTRLRRENRRLTMERDILKKATAFFAKEGT